LVPGAIDVVDATKGQLRRSPRYLFIDEFQDTDAEQMELVLSLRLNTGARLFMVGDAKQGIYRFRGAQGDAFSELRLQFGAHQLPTLEEFGLTRNFRSGRRLLDSFHKWFQSWGGAALLQYGDDSRLRDCGLIDSSSRPVEVMTFARGTKKSQVETELIVRVENWVEEHPRETVAVLCRTNKDAKRFREALREAKIPCELRVGGDFFLSPAVAEARVFIEAVLYPENDAAILEFCETRWLAGLVELIAPPDLSYRDRDVWNLGVPDLLSWSERLSSLAPTGNFDRKDLDAIRFRLQYLRSLLMKSPTLAWLLQCSATLAPKGCRMPSDVDDVEVFRYGRCFDHLVSLLDGAFQDSAISPHKVLEWLRLQIATNRSEDEPDPVNSEHAVQVTALTVHKAKGLEFDRVVIPVTSSTFGQSYGRSEIAIIPSQSGGARLAWRWKWNTNFEYSNVGLAESELWKTEEREQRREEARLLYVAMTRAKTELVIFVKAGSNDSAAQTRPNSWADLITVVS
jgi:ATP-dependent exoDNAse (exonuclease V) beta subunit